MFKNLIHQTIPDRAHAGLINMIDIEIIVHENTKNIQQQYLLEGYKKTYEILTYIWNDKNIATNPVTYSYVWDDFFLTNVTPKKEYKITTKISSYIRCIVQDFYNEYSHYLIKRYDNIDYCFLNNNENLLYTIKKPDPCVTDFKQLLTTL